MPPRISENQRWTIWTLYHDQNWSRARIANELNLDWRAVNRWTQRDNMKDLARNIKPLTDREERAMRRNIIRGDSIRESAREVNRSVGYVHKKVRRNKDNKGGIFPYKSKWKIKLTPFDKERRMAFANEFTLDDPIELLEEFKSRYWYDEKKWLLGKPPNNQNVRYWGTSPKQLRRYYPKYSSPTVIHCMVGLCWYGITPKPRWYVTQVPYKIGMNTLNISVSQSKSTRTNIMFLTVIQVDVKDSYIMNMDR